MVPASRNSESRENQTNTFMIHCVKCGNREVNQVLWVHPGGNQGMIHKLMLATRYWEGLEELGVVKTADTKYVFLCI